MALQRRAHTPPSFATKKTRCEKDRQATTCRRGGPRRRSSASSTGAAAGEDLGGSSKYLSEHYLKAEVEKGSTRTSNERGIAVPKAPAKAHARCLDSTSCRKGIWQRFQSLDTVIVGRRGDAASDTSGNASATSRRWPEAREEFSFLCKVANAGPGSGSSGEGVGGSAEKRRVHSRRPVPLRRPLKIRASAS